jgi:hypothetical protein
MRGLGGVVRSGAVGGFLLLQPSYLWAGSGRVNPGVAFNTNPVLQVGLGARWGGLTVGGALRGTRTTYEAAIAQERVTQIAFSGEQHELTHREASFGLGIAAGRVSLDAAYELLDESHYEASASVENDTVAAQMAGDLQDSGAFAVRVGVRLAESMRFVATGDYGWGRTEWSFLGYVDGQIQSTQRTQGTKTWGTSLALYVPVPHLDLFAVSATYEQRTTPHAGLGGNFYPAYNDRRTEQLLGGFALRADLWRDLNLLAGFGATWRKLDDRWDLRSYGSTQSNSETIADYFSWGLTYAWRALEVVGSFRAPPQIDAPTFAIDVHVRP